MENNELKQHALNVRRNIIDMVYAAQSGHPGGSLGCADILTYIYFEEMNVNADNLKSTNRDRFVLSKGHCSPALYAVLSEKGLIHEDLKTFRKLGSKLQGHPSMIYLEGVDMSTGSLGQGVSTAVGMAIANKIDKNENKVFTVIGDGESEEGLVWEALMAACHYKLDNLVIVFDVNNLQIDGNVQDVISPLPLKEKAEAFGAKCVECDGHDFDSLRAAFAVAKETKGQPTVIIANTVKGKGVSFMENNYAWHGAAPNAEQYAVAMEDLKEAK
ncbi:MAG: transketolase [Erysipelotrichaceae bacterium]|nr:transketolase [Erysipelotrichaceae bacterium]